MALRKLWEATRSLSRRVQGACVSEHCPGCRNASGTASTSREGGRVPVDTSAHCSWVVSRMITLLTCSTTSRLPRHAVRPAIDFGRPQQSSVHSLPHTETAAGAPLHITMDCWDNTGASCFRDLVAVPSVPRFPSSPAVWASQAGPKGNPMLYFACGGVLGAGLMGMAG